jgi:hypothetical protein
MAVARRRCALLCGIVAVAGCGGGEADPRYSAGATRRCLERSGALVSSEDAEYVAQGDVSRGYEVTIGPNRLSMAFERTSAVAATTAAGFARFFVGDDKVQRRGNTVLAWDKTPSDAERSRIESCLKPAL